MKAYEANRIFNVGLFSHGGAGKTSLAEALLFKAGAVNRLGRVDDGNATTDFDPDEIKRKMSVSLALAPLEWKGAKVNLLDSPGYADFAGEVAEAARVADGAVLVLDGVAGVQVGTESVWKRLESLQVPRLVFVNKMERENADYRRVLEQLRERYGKGLVALNVPVGAEQSFQGVVDLLDQVAWLGDADASGDVPGEASNDLASQREALVEAICEVDDDLINKYLEGEDLSADELRTALRSGVKSGQIVPVLFGSAASVKGVVPLLEAIVSYLPSAAEAAVRLRDGAVAQPESNGKLAALAFKTISDPFIGRLSFVRVYSGTLSSDSHVWNADKNRDERVGQVASMRGKQQEPAAAITTGDIGVIPKLSETSTGDTLTTKDAAIKLEGISFPEPSFIASISPKTKADVDKMSTAVARMQEEDPTLRIYREPSTGETIVAGLGESHVDIFVDRLQRKFSVGVDVGVPRVPYRETITSTARKEGRHVRQTGGHGQYGVVWLEVEPLTRGEQFQFVDKIVGGVVPKNFIPAVEKGVRESMDAGALAGYPVVDVRVSLVDGKYHPVDSSEQAFKTAGSIGFKAAMQDARPVLLEPVMDVEITVPDDFTGDVMSDLNTKRARVQGMNPLGGNTTIVAQVPQAEMLRYATDLRSITQGRGTYTMAFSHYEEVPAHIGQQVIAQRKKEQEEKA
jgi:elongation factor G